MTEPIPSSPPHASISQPNGEKGEKYNSLKRKYFEVVDDRDSALDALARAQATVARLQREKAALQDRLASLESNGHASTSGSYIPPASLPKPSLSPSPSDDEDAPPVRLTSAHIGPRARAQPPSTRVAPPLVLAQPTPEEPAAPTMSVVPRPSRARQRRGSDASEAASDAAMDEDAPAAKRTTKPKRLKGHTVVSKEIQIQQVKRDEQGRPVLPLQVGLLTVHSLGEISQSEHFHTERYIFPPGYTVTREYPSMKDPNADTTYTCRILAAPDGPRFQVLAADQPGFALTAGTATGAWSGIVRTANHIRKRKASNSVSGPDYYGLGQNVIKCLLQELPGATALRDYVHMQYSFVGPPTTAPTAAPDSSPTTSVVKLPKRSSKATPKAKPRQTITVKPLVPPAPPAPAPEPEPESEHSEAEQESDHELEQPSTSAASLSNLLAEAPEPRSGRMRVADLLDDSRGGSAPPKPIFSQPESSSAGEEEEEESEGGDGEAHRPW